MTEIESNSATDSGDVGRLGDDSNFTATPRRMKGFVKYFNSYIAALTVAVIPIPLANFAWVPIPAAQRHLFSVVTPIFCFLTIALIFSFRHFLGRLMFWRVLSRGASRGINFFSISVALVPLFLTILSLSCAGAYYSEYVFAASIMSPQLIIDRRPGLIDLVLLEKIPGGGWMALYFILSFVFAEAAFVWTSLREYLQDVLHISDKDMILGIRE